MIIKLLRQMEPVTIYMCRQATERPSHVLRTSHIATLDEEMSPVISVRYFPSFTVLCLACVVSDLRNEIKSEGLHRKRSSTQALSRRF